MKHFFKKNEERILKWLNALSPIIVAVIALVSASIIVNINIDHIVIALP